MPAEELSAHTFGLLGQLDEHFPGIVYGRVVSLPAVQPIGQIAHLCRQPATGLCDRGKLLRPHGISHQIIPCSPLVCGKRMKPNGRRGKEFLK
jgi:hypothetical protein